MNSEKKITLVVADAGSTFLKSCADAYEETAREAGASVKRLNLSEMEFDPVLHRGYDVIQELEEDLVSFQKALSWADHMVFIYPNWWNTMPAKMKGLFDRAFLPGFAFKFQDGQVRKLLSGKTGRVINIIGHNNPFLLWLRIGSFTNELEKGILGECGVSPVRVTCFGPTREGRNMAPEQKAKLEGWLEKVRKIAKRESL